MEDLTIHPLKKIPDERGAIFHMLKATDSHFTKFGEVYFSIAYPGVIKGWHEHTKQTQNYAVISGMIKLVLYDNRPASKTYKELKEIFLGDLNYSLIQIPPGIVNGYKCIGNKDCIVANCSDLPHEQGEMLRYAPDSKDIPYDWDIVMK